MQKRGRIFALCTLVIVAMLIIAHHLVLKRVVFQRHLCYVNLHFIGAHLKIHGSDHGGAYPPDLGSLRLEKPADGYRGGAYFGFSCYATGHEPGVWSNLNEWTDYVYVSGLTWDDPSAAVLAFCPPGNHRPTGILQLFSYPVRGGAVQNLSDVCALHNDGHVGIYSPEEFHSLMTNPAAFFGTADGNLLSDLQSRAKLIWPPHLRRQLQPESDGDLLKPSP